jgi:hypothetical protein
LRETLSAHRATTGKQQNSEIIMKDFTSHQRIANIISKAVALGYEFEDTNSIEFELHDIEMFIMDKTPKEQWEEDMAEYRSPNSDQIIEWDDCMGFNYWVQGKIVDWRRVDYSKDKVEVAQVINSIGTPVRLFIPTK